MKEKDIKVSNQTIAWKANIVYAPTSQTKEENIQEAFRKIKEEMDMRSGGGAPGLKHPIPCPEKKGQRGGEEVDRRERHRRELGISTEKINNMKLQIYNAMCENGVTIAEASVIVTELGCMISEAEKRSPNTKLNDIPNPRQD